MRNTIREDLNTVGQKVPSAEDITTAKKNAIKLMLGEEDLGLDNLSDDELDMLLGKAQTMQEKAEDIIDNMELLGASDFDIKEALRVNMKLKMTEAEEILKDLRLND